MSSTRTTYWAELVCLGIVALCAVMFLQAIPESHAGNTSVIKDWPAGGPQFPIIRGVGVYSAKTGVATPSVPTGTVDGDLLIMYVATQNELNISVADWTLLPTCMRSENGAGPPTCGAADDCIALHTLYNVWTTGDNTTTNDSGDKNIAVIIGIETGSFDTTTPFNDCSTNQQDSTSSISVSGGTTTTNDTLILVAVATREPDTNTTNKMSDPVNANLAALTEHHDQTKNIAAGGTMWIGSGTLATAGAVGATTSTHDDTVWSANTQLSINALP